MKVKLMNSAMMPAPGFYALREISPEMFAFQVARAQREGLLESYIGYSQNIALIEGMSGVRVPLNRAQTTVEDGDMLLVMKLKYRPASKGQPVRPEDFEYFEAEYRLRLDRPEGRSHEQLN